ncbi:MAG: hypothetical protein RID07_19385, partial [Lacipirellulaceae bacterium]
MQETKSEDVPADTLRVVLVLEIEQLQYRLERRQTASLGMERGKKTAQIWVNPLRENAGSTKSLIRA